MAQDASTESVPLWNQFWNVPMESFEGDTESEMTADSALDYSLSSPPPLSGSRFNYNTHSHVPQAAEDFAHPAIVSPPPILNRKSSTTVLAGGSNASVQMKMSYKLRLFSTGQVYRFSMEGTNYSQLMSILSEETRLPLSSTVNPMQLSPKTTAPGSTTHSQNVLSLRDSSGKDLKLCYFDEDGDGILLTSDKDLSEALGVAQKLGWTRLELFLGPEIPNREAQLSNTKHHRQSMSQGSIGTLGTGSVLAIVSALAVVGVVYVATFMKRA